MLGVSHLRNRRVLSSGFTSLGKENLQVGDPQGFFVYYDNFVKNMLISQGFYFS
jgi:hypothetical protein